MRCPRLVHRSHGGRWTGRRREKGDGRTDGRERRGCAPRNNTTGQCKYRRQGKPTMRDLEVASSAAACALPSSHACTACAHVHTGYAARGKCNRGHGRGRVAIVTAHTLAEIALNTGRTKASNNATIISDGVLSIFTRAAGELFNMASRSAARVRSRGDYVRTYVYMKEMYTGTSTHARAICVGVRLMRKNVDRKKSTRCAFESRD